jgi:arginase family enzyme
MDISIYFEPLDTLKIIGENPTPGTLGEAVELYDGNYFPEFLDCNIAIIGVEEDRRALNNKGCAGGPDYVRKFHYKLYAAHTGVRVCDLGNIKAGATIEDTYFAVSSAVGLLVKKNVLPIIIGGGQDLTYANYTAYENLEQHINIVSVDPTIDLGDVEDPLTSQSYLSKIVLHQPNYLFNYSNLGYQTFFTDPRIVDMMGKLYFDIYRLGDVRANMQEVEPVVRNADIVSFDVSAIRQSDAPGNANATPNGFYGEEACQIARYAGMSDKLSSVGFYELNPLMDHNGQTAHLVAQMVWYLMEGYHHRKNDFPIGDKSTYTKYRVAIKDHDHELIFYKSDKSDRWWMDVPYPSSERSKYERHHLVPCSYADYQIACQDEMPDKWWKTFQKLG